MRLQSILSLLWLSLSVLFGLPSALATSRSDLNVSTIEKPAVAASGSVVGAADNDNAGTVVPASMSASTAVGFLPDSTTNSNDPDVSCICSMFEEGATIKPWAVTNDKCRDALLDAMDHFTPPSAEPAENDTCEAKLARIEPAFCGFLHDPDPSERLEKEPYVPPDLDGSPRAKKNECSSSPTAGQCAFDTYDVVMQCTWITGTRCGWNIDRQSCFGDGSAEAKAACGAKKIATDCKSTYYRGARCLPMGSTEYDDPNGICTSKKDPETCDATPPFKGTKSCFWHSKTNAVRTEHGMTAYGRDAYNVCCNPPPYTTPYAGTVWCDAAGGREYVDDGRIWSGVEQWTCDAVAGYYMRNRFSREVYLSNRWTAPDVPEVDDHCCKPLLTISPSGNPVMSSESPSLSPTRVPMNSYTPTSGPTPTIYPSDSPMVSSEAPSLRPTFVPLPSAMPTSGPTPTSSPSDNPILSSETPSLRPTLVPFPSAMPTSWPKPTISPSDSQTVSSETPGLRPTLVPSPSAKPTYGPTFTSSLLPSKETSIETPNIAAKSIRPSGAPSVTESTDRKPLVVSGFEKTTISPPPTEYPPSFLRDISPSLVWGAVLGLAVVSLVCCIHGCQAMMRQKVDDEGNVDL